MRRVRGCGRHHEHLREFWHERTYGRFISWPKYRVEIDIRKGDIKWSWKYRTFGVVCYGIKRTPRMSDRYRMYTLEITRVR